MPQAIQNPRRRNSLRPADDVSRNKPTDGSHSAIVYFARMPMPTINPATGQAHARPRTAAACPNTTPTPSKRCRVRRSSSMSRRRRQAALSETRPRGRTPVAPCRASARSARTCRPARARHSRRPAFGSPGRCCRSVLRTAGQKCATAANEQGHQRTFAVVAPVEMPGPIPIMSFIGGEVERTGADEVDHM